MIMAYGQDDRVCAYTSFEAMMEIEKPGKKPVQPSLLTKKKSAVWELRACIQDF